jgi:hypothetical protein
MTLVRVATADSTCCQTTFAFATPLFQFINWILHRFKQVIVIDALLFLLNKDVFVARLLLFLIFFSLTQLLYNSKAFWSCWGGATLRTCISRW